MLLVLPALYPGAYAYHISASKGAVMLAQVRIYTINKGAMDAFLKHFREEVMPLHEKIGLPIVGTYLNGPQNEFIWIRTFKDAADREAKQKGFRDAAAGAGIQLGSNVAKMEIRDVEAVFPLGT